MTNPALNLDNPPSWRAPLRLSGLLPRSVLAGRIVALLTCYLDDSGTHPDSPLVTLAGYVMADVEWEKFEVEVEPFFKKRGVKILRGFDIQQNEGCFADKDVWKVLNKQAFIGEVGRTLKPHGPVGLSISVTRAAYEERAAGREVPPAPPYAWAFDVIANWILSSPQVGKRARDEGVSFVVERGSSDNAALKNGHDYIVANFAEELGNTMRGLSFVPKEHSRAIQMADLIAYYANRRAMQLQGIPPEQRASVDLDAVMKVILETCPPSRCEVANQFGYRDDPLPSRAELFPSPLSEG